MEIRIISICINFGHINTNITNRVSSINYKGDSLFFTESLERIDRENNWWNGAHMIKNSQFYLFRIAIDEFLNLQLNIFRTLEILRREHQLNKITNYIYNGYTVFLLNNWKCFTNTWIGDIRKKHDVICTPFERFRNWVDSICRILYNEHIFGRTVYFACNIWSHIVDIHLCCSEPFFVISFSLFLHESPVLDDTFRRVAIASMINVNIAWVNIKIGQSLLPKWGHNRIIN